MIFEPKTEQELQTMSLLSDGVYKYRVVSAEEKPSVATGNQYMSLKLEVMKKESTGLQSVYTNLALMHLLKHFCDVNNLQEQYKKGSLSAIECIGKSGGEVLIAIEPERLNPNGGVYKAKNIVKDYIGVPSSSLHQKLDFDQDVPF